VQFRHNDPDEEMVCNLIAADLLVPSSLLSEDVSEPEALATRAVDLTNKYDVTLSTLLIKAAASVETYAAFALFGKRWENARICFTTPVRSETIFRDDGIQQGVMRAFDQDRPQHGLVQVKFGGKTREFGASHVPIDPQRQVLSFVYEQPFIPRFSHAAHA
jgi:hypothetical protein